MDKLKEWLGLVPPVAWWVVWFAIGILVGAA
jgi:hypothetical protein